MINTATLSGKPGQLQYLQRITQPAPRAQSGAHIGRPRHQRNEFPRYQKYGRTGLYWGYSSGHSSMPFQCAQARWDLDWVGPWQRQRRRRTRGRTPQRELSASSSVTCLLRPPLRGGTVRVSQKRSTGATVTPGGSVLCGSGWCSASRAVRRRLVVSWELLVDLGSGGAEGHGHRWSDSSQMAHELLQL
jgi:hypothetical protein